MNIILGGTHGLGAEIAQLVKDPFVIGRSYDEKLHGTGMRADLADLRDVAAIVDFITANQLTGFYWVAGYGYMGDFSDQKDVLHMATVNFAHVLPIAQAAWSVLQSAADGVFAVVSSTTGIKARANEAIYAATKHAQVGFTRSLGLEAERLGISTRVSLFLPGGMQTPFWPEDNKPSSFGDFLNPRKVAREIVQDSTNQTTPYFERMIDRGSYSDYVYS